MATKKLPFLNPNAAPLKPPNLWATIVDVWRQVWKLVGVFIGIIFVCGMLFYFGTPHGWGIQPTFPGSGVPNVPVQIGFLDCIYFSVVTITTLGYGDYRPESYGRFIAAFEVLGGIVLMGIFVSQLVSRHQDRMTKRLVHGQLNTEIQGFRAQLSNLRQAFKDHPPILTGEKPSNLLRDSRGLVTSIARYWRHEALSPDLGDFIPLRAAGRLLGELIELLQSVTAQVVGKSNADLHANDLKSVRGIAESTLLVATVLSERVTDHGLNHSHSEVVRLVKCLRKQLDLHRPGHGTTKRID